MSYSLKLWKSEAFQHVPNPENAFSILDFVPLLPSFFRVQEGFIMLLPL